MLTASLRTIVSVILCCTAFLAAQVLFVSAKNTESALLLEPVPSPAGIHSSEPRFTSQGDDVFLSWVETQGDRATLKFAKRSATGWSEPRSGPNSDHFFPQLGRCARGSRTPRRHDRGAVAAPETALMQTPMLMTCACHGPGIRDGRGRHRRARITTAPKPSTVLSPQFPTPGAGLGLVWLDGRATNPETEAGDMSLRASVYDAAGKQFREMLVAPRVCDCCATAAAETSEGVIVAFRNRSAGEIRDIYVSRFTGGHWSSPAVVHDDNWRIDACPINGPAISARGQNVAVAWFTGKDNQAHTFVAFSTDGGRTFGPADRVDTGVSIGRVGVQLLDDGSAAVTWIESVQQQSLFPSTDCHARGNRFRAGDHIRLGQWLSTSGRA